MRYTSPSVCSLPMRDGNNDNLNYDDLLEFVCSLPMRDGNLKNVKEILGGFNVCSLPMRDGNSNSGSRGVESV